MIPGIKKILQTSKMGQEVLQKGSRNRMASDTFITITGKKTEMSSKSCKKIISNLDFYTQMTNHL